MCAKAKKQKKTKTATLEVSPNGAKDDAASLAEKVEREKLERAAKCLRAIEADIKEHNCVIDIATMLTSAPGAAPITHQINVRALDW